MNNFLLGFLLLIAQILSGLVFLLHLTQCAGKGYRLYIGYIPSPRIVLIQHSQNAIPAILYPYLTQIVYCIQSESL